MKGGPYAGAKTVFLPPMTIVRAGLRAYWVTALGPSGSRSYGTCRAESVRARPARPLRHPSGAQRLGIVPEVDADLLQDRVRIVLEQLQPLAPQHLVIGNLAGDVGDKAALRAVRAARLASRPLGRRDREAGACCCSSISNTPKMSAPWAHIPPIIASGNGQDWPICAIDLCGSAAPHGNPTAILSGTSWWRSDRAPGHPAGSSGPT